MEVGGHSVSTTKFCRCMNYASPKPANISKVADVKQDPDKLSFAFLEHSLDAYYLHTLKGPKDLANLNMVNLTIVFCWPLTYVEGFKRWIGLQERMGQNC